MVLEWEAARTKEGRGLGADAAGLASVIKSFSAFISRSCVREMIQELRKRPFFSRPLTGKVERNVVSYE